MVIGWPFRAMRYAWLLGTVNLDGLIGVKDALAQQMAQAQKAFDALFIALRN